MDRVNVLARARAETHVMQPRASLRETSSTILRGSARNAEAGPAADTVQIVGRVPNDEGQSEERQQAPIKRCALVEAIDAQINMRYAIDFHCGSASLHL